jgi:hypothetical protein
MTIQHLAQDAGTAANSAASATVVGVQILGVGLPDWVAIISGVYFLISTGFLVMKVHAWRKARDSGTTLNSPWAD